MTHPGIEPEMENEWLAWRLVCIELQHASAAIDINVEPRLHRALVLWGECVAALRRTQDPEDCAKWLEEAKHMAAAEIDAHL